LAAKKKAEEDSKATAKDPKVGDAEEIDAKKKDKNKNKKNLKKDKDVKATE
jgi:hypothetical protein